MILGELWVILTILSAGCFITGALALWEKGMEKNCELCKLVRGNIKTRLYCRSSELLIVDCQTCQIPMLVFKNHGQADEGQRRRGMAAVDTLFDYTEIRKVPRRIPGHEHWHIIGAVASRYATLGEQK